MKGEFIIAIRKYDYCKEKKKKKTTGIEENLDGYSSEPSHLRTANCSNRA